MNLLTTIAEIIRSTVLAGAADIQRTTTASDVRGWDSLSHTMIVVAIEDHFKIQLPTDRIVALANVGELVDLVEETLAKARSHA